MTKYEELLVDIIRAYEKCYKRKATILRWKTYNAKIKDLSKGEFSINCQVFKIKIPESISYERVLELMESS